MANESQHPNKLLFIGAGASYGARWNFSARPPLGAELCGWLRRQCEVLRTLPGLIDLRSTVVDAQAILQNHRDIENFELLLSKLSRDERICLQRLLLIAFTDLRERQVETAFGFENTPDAYDSLIRHFKISAPEWAIVSLNYDLLFEEALRRNNIEFLYPHFPFLLDQKHEGRPELHVYKPHGSINFFAHGDYRIFHEEPPPDADRGRPTKFSTRKDGTVVPVFPIAMAGPAGAENVLHVAMQGGISFPVMANYTKGKDSDINEKTLSAVREEALRVSSQVEELIVIGVRPIFSGEDDPFVSELLSIKAHKINYVSPSAQETEAILAKHPQATTYNCTLKDFLKL